MHDTPFDELLSAYLDGEISPEEREHVERLLETSPDAQCRLNEFVVLSDLVRSLPLKTAPEELAPAVRLRTERETLLGPASSMTLAGTGEGGTGETALEGPLARSPGGATSTSRNPTSRKQWTSAVTLAAASVAAVGILTFSLWQPPNKPGEIQTGATQNGETSVALGWNSDGSSNENYENGRTGPLSPVGMAAPFDTVEADPSATIAPGAAGGSRIGDARDRANALRGVARESESASINAEAKSPERKKLAEREKSREGMSAGAGGGGMVGGGLGGGSRPSSAPVRSFSAPPSESPADSPIADAPTAGAAARSSAPASAASSPTQKLAGAEKPGQEKSNAEKQGGFGLKSVVRNGLAKDSDATAHDPQPAESPTGKTYADGLNREMTAGKESRLAIPPGEAVLWADSSNGRIHVVEVTVKNLDEAVSHLQGVLRRKHIPIVGLDGTAAYEEFDGELAETANSEWAKSELTKSNKAKEQTRLEASPGGAKPNHAKSGEAKPGEAKPGDPKPGVDKSGIERPGEKSATAKSDTAKSDTAKSDTPKASDEGLLAQFRKATATEVRRQALATFFEQFDQAEAEQESLARGAGDEASPPERLGLLVDAQVADVRKALNELSDIPGILSVSLGRPVSSDPAEQAAQFEEKEALPDGGKEGAALRYFGGRDTAGHNTSGRDTAARDTRGRNAGGLNAGQTAGDGQTEKARLANPAGADRPLSEEADAKKRNLSEAKAEPEAGKTQRKGEAEAEARKGRTPEDPHPEAPAENGARKGNARADATDESEFGAAERFALEVPTLADVIRTRLRPGARRSLGNADDLLTDELKSQAADQPAEAELPLTPAEIAAGGERRTNQFDRRGTPGPGTLTPGKLTPAKPAGGQPQGDRASDRPVAKEMPAREAPFKKTDAPGAKPTGSKPAPAKLTITKSLEPGERSEPIKPSQPADPASVAPGRGAANAPLANAPLANARKAGEKKSADLGSGTAINDPAGPMQEAADTLEGVEPKSYQMLVRVPVADDPAALGSNRRRPLKDGRPADANGVADKLQESAPAAPPAPVTSPVVRAPAIPLPAGQAPGPGTASNRDETKPAAGGVPAGPAPVSPAPAGNPGYARFADGKPGGGKPARALPPAGGYLPKADAVAPSDEPSPLADSKYGASTNEQLRARDLGPRDLGPRDSEERDGQQTGRGESIRLLFVFRVQPARNNPTGAAATPPVTEPAAPASRPAAAPPP